MKARRTRKLQCELLDQRLLLTADLINTGTLDHPTRLLPMDTGSVEFDAPRVGLESTDFPQQTLLAGDANRDGLFDQTDVLQVLTAGKYLTAQPATWSEGDWNGDNVFDQHDLVMALQTAEYADGSFLARAFFGELYHDGDVVRTIVPPAASPKPGIDDLYVVPGQRAVAAVAPGDPGYHGGKWAVHVVTWNVESYTLTSEAAVLAAADAGDINIERKPAMDFKCPIQP